MDYVVGSIAALISGNVTPNRPKLIRRALTPTKHPVSPNVTPKSEAVEDRSIFLSPSVQKKKDIVKKSPKRIFQNPDLDVTEASEILSPKADKVKKHLVEDLESGIMGKSSILDKKSPSSKLDKSIDTASPNKKSKINHAKDSNESTPKKNKRNSQSATLNEEIKSSNINSKSPKNTEIKVEEAAKTNKTPKKNKRKSKSELNNTKSEVMDVDQTTQVKSPKKKLILEAVGVEDKENQEDPTKASKASLTVTSNEQGSKKKNKKRKKKLKKTNKEESVNKPDIKQNTTDIKATSEVATETKNKKKKKNRKNKKKKLHLEIKPPQQETKAVKSEDNEESSQEKVAEKVDSNESNDDDEEKTNVVKSPGKITIQEVHGNESSDNESDEDDDDDEEETKVAETPGKMIIQEVHGNESSDNESDEDDDDSEEEEEEVSNIANPNAITEKDSDSEHDSDNEIESDIETSNAEALKTEKTDESSDDEEELPKKGKTKKAKELSSEEKNDGIKEVNTEDEIKRTLFVGNVPFSNKCKKEIKKIFAQYGEIETVRIRTVPVKDARVTPKLAVIRNEIHPDRSTVNVYIKFVDPDSVDRALSENNTVLNDHHLRVTRSAATGVEHNPACAVFVGNLPFGIEDETLRGKFEGCGEVQSVRIVRDRKTNAGKGFGYVNFATKDAVELALELSEEDLTVKNRIMRVKRCTNTLSKGPKKGNQSVKPQRNENQNRNFGNNHSQNRNFGNNQGQNRNFGNNQGQNRNFGNNQGQNRNFGNNGPNRGGRNNQGPSRSFGNNQRNFGNQGQRSFGNNQGQNRNFGNNQGRSFGNQGNEASGATRRLMNKRPHQESGDGPPNKRQNVSPAPREKKQRNEFVGITAEKKKKQKFDKGQKKKKALSEILTKKRD